MFERIKTYFRKHDYDLENPEIVEVINICQGLYGGQQEIKFKLKRVRCRNCGKELSLNLDDILIVPLARGCSGKSK